MTLLAEGLFDDPEDAAAGNGEPAAREEAEDADRSEEAEEEPGGAAASKRKRKPSTHSLIPASIRERLLDEFMVGSCVCGWGTSGTARDVLNAQAAHRALCTREDAAAH